MRLWLWHFRLGKVALVAHFLVAHFLVAGSTTRSHGEHLSVARSLRTTSLPGKARMDLQLVRCS